MSPVLACVLIWGVHLGAIPMPPQGCANHYSAVIFQDVEEDPDSWYVWNAYTERYQFAGYLSEYKQTDKCSIAHVPCFVIEDEVAYHERSKDRINKQTTRIEEFKYGIH